MNILVVDDKQLAVNALVRKVSAVDEGGACTGLTSPHEAVEWARQNRPDVVFTDIEMPGMGGLELAKAVREASPRTNVIFTTAHAEYALQAHGLYPSGYLMKPVSEDDVRGALENLRYPVLEMPNRRIKANCFGAFDVFADGVPLKFKRSKTKELLAYLIDRRGSRVTVGEILAVLWEDGKDTPSRRSQVRNLISDLRSTLAAAGVPNVLVRGRDSIAIVPELIDCDYYHFLEGSYTAVNSYIGEYMTQYPWAEMTLSQLNY